ncbi:hypothetical protein GCM10009865_47680 [Aeromicrobium ponti]|uniref:Uncharacterized protein DUF4376 n=1 Tax=Cytobacillus oceanisediminis TaxID=665099 RepID=A0A562JCW5_9BACI|nr:DUF4376 domain-containing protein [Cytobacillus oceanisediminis]TWH80989.1 uncharacterized protein DUF4376 [Cytobacillus oceanisediminis]
MEKLVIYNENFEVVDTIMCVSSSICEINKVSVKADEDTVTYEGFRGSYIVVDEAQDEIYKEEVIDFIKQLKLKELSEECNTYIIKGFEHNGDHFEFDYKDQTNFNQQLSLFLLNPSITSVIWKTSNNGVKNFTKDEFIAICMSGENHKRSSIGRYWSLKETILTTSYQSIDELKSIRFN